MAIIKIEFKPGIFNEDTELGGEGTWYDADKVRFYKGRPQKIGGWAKQSSSQFTGICRGIFSWVDFDVSKWVALGTHTKLYIYGTAFTDITPIRKTTNPMGNNPFATVNNSPTVTVTDVGHGAVVGDYVTFSSSDVVAGLDMDAEWTVTTLVDADNYTITHTSNASATTTGGGATAIATYQINVGGVNGVYGLGWGAGTWGQSTWGTARSTSTIFYYPRSWSFSKWGEDLIANPRGGGVYVWDASTGISSRATLITNAPSTVQFVLVSPEARHIVAYGAHDGSTDNLMNIRWCAREDYTNWTPSSTNTAGSKLLDTGNTIFGAIHTNQEILVFTDESVYSQRFIGGNEVFSFMQLGDGLGLIGPHAMVEYGDTVFWMGGSDFFMYDGQVHTLPCDVKRHIFDNIEVNQRQKCHAGVNSYFDEVWWFYPRTSNTEISHYVIYNYKDKTWSIGSMARTAWLDHNEVHPRPIATSDDRYLYNQEQGTDDGTSAISAYVESGDFDLGDGNLMFYLSQVFPEFKDLSGSISLTVKTRDDPVDTERTIGPFTVATTTRRIDLNARGRQGAIRIASSAVGDDWRLGTLRINIKPDGLQ